MSCLPPFSGEHARAIERKDILPTIRQGYLTKRTLHNRGRKVLSPKDKLVFVILSPNGLYIFDHDSLQRNQHTNKYIELSENGLKFEDKTDYEAKRFQFDLVSDVRHIQFQCLDYNEKDNWMISCNLAVDLCARKSPKEEEWNMTADVSVTISQAKDLLPCNGSHGDHYCLVIMDKEAKKTETIHNKPDPKWTQGGTFKFQIHKMPEDLLIVVFDAKNHHDALGQVYLKIDSARTSNDLDDWYPLRPVNVGERAAGKLHVKVQCRYDAETQRRVTFGVHLQDLMQRPDYADLIVPDLAFKCLTRLHRTSLKTQGLFRVSGNKNKIRDYETQWDRRLPNESVELNETEDEHTVAGLFKLFLRELPEPLIPYQYYDLVMEASKDPDRSVRIVRLKELIAKLPMVNRDLLFYTCSLLHSLTKYADVNLMKPTNLAIVFGSVFSYSPPDRQIPKPVFLTTHLPQLTATCENLIQEFYEVFNIDPNSDPMEHLKSCGNRKSSTSQNNQSSGNNDSFNVNGTDVLVH